MSDINLITGNLSVKGTFQTSSNAYIPSGYTTNSFLPFNPQTNIGTWKTSNVWILNDGSLASIPLGFSPSRWATGLMPGFNFPSQDQLSRHIRTQKWNALTGDSLNPGGLIQGKNPTQINATGQNVIPTFWTSQAQVPNRAFWQARLTSFTIDERFNHIEQSGVFALLSGEKIGFGTYNPQEKVDIEGNLALDGYINPFEGNVNFNYTGNLI